MGQDERGGLAGQFRQAYQNLNTPFDGYDFDDGEEAASPLNLGRMSAQAQHQDPALLGSMFGGNSSLGGTIGKAALGALAALLIRQIMNSQQSRSYGQDTPMSGMGADPLARSSAVCWVKEVAVWAEEGMEVSRCRVALTLARS